MTLTQDQKNKIRKKIKSVESHVFGEILVAICSQSAPTKWVSWILSLIGAWMGLCLYLFVNPIFDLVWALLFFMLGASIGWSLGFIQRIQKLIVPDFVEQKFAQQEAFRVFYSNGVSRTPSKSGVLFFISLFEREIDVLVDEAVQKAVSQEELDYIIKVATPFLKKGQLFEAIMNSLNEIETLLDKHFHRSENKTDEWHEELIEIKGSWL